MYLHIFLHISCILLAIPAYFEHHHSIPAYISIYKHISGIFRAYFLKICIQICIICRNMHKDKYAIICKFKYA